MAPAILQHRSSEQVSSRFSPSPHVYVLPPSSWFISCMPKWHRSLAGSSLACLHIYIFISKKILTAVALLDVTYSTWAFLLRCMARGNTDIHFSSCHFFQHRLILIHPLNTLLPPVVHLIPLLRPPLHWTFSPCKGHGKLLDREIAFYILGCSERNMKVKSHGRKWSIINTRSEWQAQGLLNCMLFTFSDCF